MSKNTSSSLMFSDGVNSCIRAFEIHKHNAVNEEKQALTAAIKAVESVLNECGLNKSIVHKSTGMTGVLRVTVHPQKGICVDFFPITKTGKVSRKKCGKATVWRYWEELDANLLRLEGGYVPAMEAEVQQEERGR